MAYLKNWTDNFFKMFFMGTSWVAVSINNIKTRAEKLRARYLPSLIALLVHVSCSKDVFIIMESGTLHGSHNCFGRILLIPSSLFLASHAFNVRMSLGSVGVKYNDDRLGLLPK